MVAEGVTLKTSLPLPPVTRTDCTDVRAINGAPSRATPEPLIE